MIYWEKETICNQTFSTAYSPNGMMVCFADDSTMRLAVESDSFDRIVESLTIRGHP